MSRTLTAETIERSEINPTPSVLFQSTSVVIPEFGAWLSPVERCVRDAEVPGSNPGAPM